MFAHEAQRIIDQINSILEGIRARIDVLEPLRDRIEALEAKVEALEATKAPVPKPQKSGAAKASVGE